jgi:hypothetical protein
LAIYVYLEESTLSVHMGARGIARDVGAISEDAHVEAVSALQVDAFVA